MNKEKLQQNLINTTTRLYCVLDGASVPNLPMRLFETGARNYCLFKGDLKPDMLYMAPYVVQLKPGDTMTEWVMSEGFGKHWGIFVNSRHKIAEMRRHFRSLVKVYDERANSMTFRFYDPRVLRRFLPTCTPQELETFFGKVDTFFAEAEDGESLLSYRLENGALKQTELN
jgi:hypothetical protein